MNITDESWIAVSALADAELKAVRGRLETPGLSIADSEFLRGKIAAFKQVLALASAENDQVFVPTVDYLQM